MLRVHDADAIRMFIWVKMLDEVEALDDLAFDFLVLRILNYCLTVRRILQVGVIELSAHNLFLSFTKHQSICSEK